jgi:hypothetical protein
MSMSSPGRDPWSGSTVGQDADQVGLYRYDVIGDSWAWSTEVFQMYGYPCGGVEPTTELLRKHEHPEDEGSLVEVIEQACRTGQSFSHQQRIVAADGRTIVLLFIGQVEAAVDGTPSAVHGYFVDVTTGRTQEAEQLQELADEAAGLQRALLSRASIEQAKGMIMLAYGCTASAAFEVLIDASQRANTKLRELAAELVRTMQTGTAQPEHARDHLERALLRLSNPRG